MSKQIIFYGKAQEAIMRGVDLVSDAVRLTMGPRGRNVALDKGYGAPTITNDGVSIAKEISLTDKLENMGAEIVKEVAGKTNDTAGDGTTTAIVLTQAMAKEGFRHVGLGVNAMGIKMGIEEATEEIVANLRKMAKPIQRKSEIAQVATIAAESEEIGKIIAETIEKVGKDGVVTVEESQSFGVQSEVVEGLQFDKGYVSPYMITNSERMEAEYRDVPIVITDKKISSVQDIFPVLEKLAHSGKKEVVIIAEEIDGEALTTFVVNKLRGTFSVLGVKAPGYGDRKKDILQDIAVVTGGKVISEEVGVKMESVELSMLGRASRIIATKDTTTIVGGKGKKSAIEERLNQLKKALEAADSKYDREKFEERIAKLSGGVAVLKVGAATESEMKYLKLKIEDAVNATKAAIDEGIVPGGGTALIRAGEKIRAKDMKAKVPSFQKEFEIGVQIVMKAIEAPIAQIAKNAGREDSEIIVDKVRKGKGNSGYDAQKNDFADDLVELGIIDPVKVTRSALENASSAVGILLTTEAAVVDEPKKEEQAQASGGMG